MIENSTTKVVILNAPPSSGKDEVAKTFLKFNTPAPRGTANSVMFSHKEFKSQLIRLAKTIWGIPDDLWDQLYARENKETPSPFLGNMSPRQALIHTSETVIKPNYGTQYFGHFAAKTLNQGIVNVFSDGGFPDEVIPVVDAVGMENILIIRIHRPGFDFSSDSRDYLADGTCKYMVDLYNDGTLQEFFAKTHRTVFDWLDALDK